MHAQLSTLGKHDVPQGDMTTSNTALPYTPKTAASLSHTPLSLGNHWERPRTGTTCHATGYRSALMQHESRGWPADSNLVADASSDIIDGQVNSCHDCMHAVKIALIITVFIQFGC